MVFFKQHDQKDRLRVIVDVPFVRKLLSHVQIEVQPSQMMLIFCRSALILRCIIRSTFAEVLRFRSRPRIFQIHFDFVFFLYLVIMELIEERGISIFVAICRSKSPFK